MVRIVLFPLLLSAGLGFLTTIGMRVLGLFSAQLGSSGPNGILFGALGGLTLFSMPALRLLGKDAWFLRKGIRAGLRRENSGAETQPVEAEVTDDEVDEQDDWHMSNSSLRQSGTVSEVHHVFSKGRTTSPYPFT